MDLVYFIKIAISFAEKGNGIVTCRDILSLCEDGGLIIEKSLKDQGLMVFVNDFRQEHVAAFDVIKGSSISYKKDSEDNFVLLRSHIDAILDTVETKGHLEIYVGDELVFEVKG